MNIFKPEIKDKKCKHDWKKLSAKIGTKIEFEYLICPKCNSTAGEEINY